METVSHIQSYNPGSKQKTKRYGIWFCGGIIYVNGLNYEHTAITIYKRTQEHFFISSFFNRPRLMIICIMFTSNLNHAYLTLTIQKKQNKQISYKRIT